MVSARKPEPRPCSTCGAPMLWALTTKQKRMPVDAAPVPEGNMVLAMDAAGALHAEAFNPEAHAGRNRYVSHFATCAQASQHRRQREQATEEGAPPAQAQQMAPRQVCGCGQAKYSCPACGYCNHPAKLPCEHEAARRAAHG